MNLNGRKSLRNCELNKETISEFIIYNKIIKADVLVRYLKRLRKDIPINTAISKYLNSPNPKGYEVVQLLSEEGIHKSVNSSKTDGIYLVHEHDVTSSLNKTKEKRYDRLLIQEIMDEGNYTPIEIEYSNSHFLLGAFHFFENPEDIIEKANSTDVNKEYVKNTLKKESIYISTLNFPEQSIKRLVEEYGIENLMIPINASGNGQNYLKKSLEGLNIMFYDVEYKEILKNLYELHYYIT